MQLKKGIKIMNRIQTFSLFVGTIGFVFAGVLLESLRYTYDCTLWPSIGDAILILFLVALITAGLFLIFNERWRVWPILLSTITGLILGALSYFFFLTFASEYTATAFIKVLPSVGKGPMTIASVQVDRDILYRHRLTMTKLITQQSSFNELLKIDEVRNTKWFASHNANIVDVVDDLNRHLIVNAQRDSDYVAVSMTCGSPDEAALIVNRMVDWFVTNQRTGASTDILAQLADLRAQQNNLENDFKMAVSSLDELRMASARENITDLEEHTFQNSISKRLDDLQSEHDKLVQDMKQAETVLANRQQQATEPNNVQVALQVENYIKSDPIMVTLGQQLILKELELAEKATGSNKNQPVESQTEWVIKIIRGKIETRKALIRDSILLANHKNAQDELVGLRYRLEEVQQMLAEVGVKKKDYNQRRAQYESLLAIKNERQRKLFEFNSLIEKYEMMRTDPEIVKVIKVEDASEPLDASFPKLGIFLPGGTMLGFIIGAGISLCIRKAKEQNIAKDL